MNNYLKSELYRIIHSRAVYLFIVCCSAFVLFLELMLKVFPTKYTTTKFAFSSMYSNLGVVMILCLSIVSIVFADEAKNHTLKNSVAYGISRGEMFFGRFIAELLVSAMSFVVVIGAYILGGYTMLNDSGSVYLTQLITGMVGAIPILILCVVLAHSLFYIIDNELTISIVWVVIMYVIPRIIALIGNKVAIAKTISNWMPWYIITDFDINEKTGKYILGWLTNEGVMRCILVGIIGSVVCYIIGLIAFNKKEIK